MRVFVLCTGRCGSMTFAKACSHITNFTAAHESGRYADWSYTDQHIEVDCRLSWFLGTIAERYPEARFACLSRRREAVLSSFGDLWPLLQAYVTAFMYEDTTLNGERLAGHYVDAVTANIEEFLRDREALRLSIEAMPGAGFERFWREIGAEGDYEAAAAEFTTSWNAYRRH